MLARGLIIGHARIRNKLSVNLSIKSFASGARSIPFTKRRKNNFFVLLCPPRELS